MRIVLLLLLGIAPAFACLNDTEVAERDREFRNSYGEQARTASTNRHQVSVPGMIAAGVGMLLLGSAGTWLMLRRA